MGRIGSTLDSGADHEQLDVVYVLRQRKVGKVGLGVLALCLMTWQEFSCGDCLDLLSNDFQCYEMVCGFLRPAASFGSPSPQLLRLLPVD